MAMYENQPVEIEVQDSGPGRGRTRLIAIFLLAVMLCTVTVTPIAVIYRWYQQRPQTQLAIIEEGAGIGGVNRIAYIDPNEQLSTVAPDGSARRQLTDDNRSHQFPAWSPDGSRLAVVSDDSLITYLDRDAAEETGAFNVLYADDNDRPFYLYWAPDSRGVSFLTSHPEGIALHLANVDPIPASQTLAIGQPFYWDWDPSGDEILIHSGASGDDSRLAYLNQDRNEISENIADPGLFQAPGFAFDGRYMAYAQVDDFGVNQVTIHGIDDQKQNTEQSLGQVAMSWSPVDHLLAYISSDGQIRSYYGPLKLVNAESGDRRTLISDTVIAFFWSPDGRSIAYFTVTELSEDSIQVKAESSKRDSLSKPSMQENRLRLELWAVGISGQEPKRLITFEPSRVFLTQFLPFFDQYALSHRLWSPASDALVIPITEGESSLLYIVPVNGESPTPVAPGSIGFWSHQ
jgi:TolB protein